MLNFESVDTSKLKPNQKARFAKLLKQVRETEQKAADLLERADGRKRRDRDRRCIVLGALLQTRLEEDRIAREVYDVLLAGVNKEQRYLFPEVWPHAPRPLGREKKATLEGATA